MVDAGAERLDVRRMLEKLVSYDTTSRNSNLELIGFVEDYLSSHGISSRRVYDAEKRKANLYATVGPEDRGGIMLSGHVDVVPVDGQAWTTDPFTLTEKDDKLYARGACDMKGFVALMLVYAVEAKRRGLATPLHLAISYDEEVGCVGVRGLIDMLNDLPVKPLMCIVGEPTGMQPTVAHKGKRSFRGHVRGKECHSSLAPQGVNAVEYAAEMVAYIRGVSKRLRREGPFDDKYDVVHTTAHVGVMHGGTALNIVPKDCSFDFEFRHLPEQDPDALFDEVRRFADETLGPEMRATDPDAGFSWEEISSIPALAIEPDAEVVTLVKQLAERNDHGKVAFGTEAGLFQTRGGIPTVVCGPGHIDQAHKPDEFISLEQLRKGEVFMERLLDRVCAR